METKTIVQKISNSALQKSGHCTRTYAVLLKAQLGSEGRETMLSGAQWLLDQKVGS